jgi:hypothetical protein
MVFSLLITKAAHGNNPHMGKLIIPKKSCKNKDSPMIPMEGIALFPRWRGME